MSNTINSSSEIFQPLSDNEVATALYNALQESVVLSGQTEEHIALMAKLEKVDTSLKVLLATLHDTKRSFKFPLSAIMSFVIGEHKYLFKGQCQEMPNNQLQITISSSFYCIQRRNQERVKVPDHYFSLVKLTNIDGVPQKIFGILKNISLGGFLIQVKGITSKVTKGSLIKSTLSIKSRPPEDLDFVVKHVKNEMENNSPIQIIGGTFQPENSSVIPRRVNSIIMDIYRETIRNIEDKK